MDKKTFKTATHTLTVNLHRGIVDWLGAGSIISHHDASLNRPPQNLTPIEVHYLLSYWYQTGQVLV